MILKVASWNIWIKSEIDAVLGTIRTLDADILALQEVQADDAARDLIRPLTNDGYQYRFAPARKKHHGQIWNDGPALFSRYPIVDSSTVILSDTQKRVAIHARVELPTQSLTVVATHLLHTHQRQSAVHTMQISQLISHLPSSKTVLMGDLKATPESEAIQRLRTILHDTDSSGTPTWSIYPEGCTVCKPRALADRLDYIFVTDDLSVLSATVERSVASDHLPITAEIELPNA